MERPKTYKKVRALPKLKEVMQERNIKQWHVAKATNLTENSVHKIINGYAGSRKSAKLIATYLKINQAELFEVITNTSSKELIQCVNCQHYDLCKEWEIQTFFERKKVIIRSNRKCPNYLNQLKNN